MDPIDYTEILTGISLILQEISDTHKLIKDEQVTRNELLAQQNLILGDIRDDIRTLKDRGNDEHLGIVVRQIHWEDEKCNNRNALVRMALKDSGMLEEFNRARSEEKISSLFTDCDS